MYSIMGYHRQWKKHLCCLHNLTRLYYLRGNGMANIKQIFSTRPSDKAVLNKHLCHDNAKKSLFLPFFPMWMCSLSNKSVLKQRRNREEVRGQTDRTIPIFKHEQWTSLVTLNTIHIHTTERVYRVKTLQTEFRWSLCWRDIQ